MVSKITIKNMFGVKEETVLNFEQKHLKGNQIGFEKGIIDDNGQKLMLTPILIGKNASGKTSILNSITTILNTETIEDFTKLILDNYMTIIQNEEEEIFANMSYIFSKVFKDADVIRRSNFENIIDTLKGLTENQKLECLHDIKINLKEDMNFSRRKRMADTDELDMPDKLSDIHDFNPFRLFEDRIYKKINKLVDSKEFSGVLANNFLSATLKDDYVKGEIDFSDNHKRIIYLSNDHICFQDSKTGINIDEKLTDFMNEIISKIKNGELYSEKYYLYLNIYKFLESEIDYDDLRIFWTQLDKEKLRLSSPSAYARHRMPFMSKYSNKIYSILDDESIRIKIRELKISDARRHLYKSTPRLSALKRIESRISFKWLNSLVKKLDSNVLTLESHDGTILIYDKNEVVVPASNLSYGTLKTLLIIDEILNTKSQLLLVDEIENGLNISLIKLLISLINNSDVNKNKKQMILTSHNPLILDQKIVSPYNAFINLDGVYKVPTALGLISRTEDYDQIFNPKNYTNELFWFKKTNEEFLYNSNTIKNSWVRSIVSELEDELEDEL